MKLVVVTDTDSKVICVLKADTFYRAALKRAIEEDKGVEVIHIPDLTWPENEGVMNIEVEAQDGGEDCSFDITLTLAHLYE
jgi:hypothetical protein